jgi:hypothetical protein
MKPRVYLETSIISYLTARPSRDIIIAAHQELTNEWWENRRKRFDLFVHSLLFRKQKQATKMQRKNVWTSLNQFHYLS